MGLVCMQWRRFLTIKKVLDGIYELADIYLQDSMEVILLDTVSNSTL